MTFIRGVPAAWPRATLATVLAILPSRLPRSGLGADVHGLSAFWAIYVLPVSVWTRPYMTLIDPFRRRLVYPALLRRIHESWARQFPI